MAETRTPGTFNATGPGKPLTDAPRCWPASAAGVHADAQLTWVPTKFLEAHKVSPWSDLPVWVPGQGETAGFARRDIGKALKAGLTYRPLPSPRPTRSPGSSASRRSARRSCAPGSDAGARAGAAGRVEGEREERSLSGSARAG